MNTLMNLLFLLCCALLTLPAMSLVEVKVWGNDEDHCFKDKRVMSGVFASAEKTVAYVHSTGDFSLTQLEASASLNDGGLRHLRGSRDLYECEASYDECTSSGGGYWFCVFICGHNPGRRLTVDDWTITGSEVAELQTAVATDISGVLTGTQCDPSSISVEVISL